ncbi:MULTISPECIES: LeuD/DmdB family oxidoreductase small subunit [Erwinia]|uniref:3-isopropylmalate dehydratase n=1 Tax=Erwinia rhapontici TaxID=55212 RepID=A0ABM7N5T4_ERWRD|nr:MULTISPECIES: 3-isopropylmalate dehydratase [Erwinia]MCS3608297.1 3-isopropylmalate/(R)-2-methylmalate dehydratase small subunit [Erwinia rhapontici]NKG31578.1 3-isopropylmalate dehydratase [Erwinia rhapontici]NNS08222.1 3-isopropylmalate dehydratase [Erwinia sp. JH02]BCQ36844.1 3-isopropylmalate dehydratase small subunit [Erwinia rhapontici]BCQ47173.1 3-isopropylmalate dehydratase small subunit [Erwinia rhapontici]
MESIISGAVYVLGDNIDTDQILTAEYLKVNPSTPEGYAQLASLAMCGLPEGALPFIDVQSGRSAYPIIVAGKNFGCGSSREHAVMALGAAGVQAVIARSYARIFFRNCVATGELLPVATTAALYQQLQTGDRVSIDTCSQTVTVLATGEQLAIDPVGELANIIDAGGLFAYARASGRIRTG